MSVVSLKKWRNPLSGSMDAIELESQVGPSFGNSLHSQDTIGTAHDLWAAYREGAFGKHPRPIVGRLMIAEDAPKSQRPVNDRQRFIQESLYSAACAIASPLDAAKTGQFSELSELTASRPL